MKARKGFIAAVVLAATLSSVPGSAQERENPFVPPPSEDERRALEDERIKNIVLEMQPQIKSMIMQEVMSAQSALEIKLRRRIDEATASPGGIAAAGTQSGPNGGQGSAPLPGVPAPGSQTIPEGSTFISCVNGKALYRDADNTLFQVTGNGVPGSDRCAG